MKYEIRIFAKDRNKIIEFVDQSGNQNLRFMPTEWEDLYYAMGSVIDDDAEKKEESDKVVAVIEVKEINFDEVMDRMVDDLTPPLTQVLDNGQEQTVFRIAA
ncbi:MAG TPA: hypothetical protein DCS93_17745 [Microscillaceae bacterium]|nr:hypothetical protein [Microscillaceae bacterium]